jgi:arylsulfatase A-like enzyme
MTGKLKIKSTAIATLAFIIFLGYLLFFNIGNRKTAWRSEKVVFEKLDGVKVFNIASLQDDHLLAGAWRSPILGTDGHFGRSLLAPGGRISFYLPVKEDVVIHLQTTLRSGLQLRLGKRVWVNSQNDMVEILPAELLRAGYNKVELLLASGEVQIRHPKRLMRMDNFRQLRGDMTNFFLPGKLVFALKPLAGEELWLQVSWKHGMRLIFELQITGENGKRLQKMEIESGKPFQLPLLPGQYQRLSLQSLGNRQGVLRIDGGELRRPLLRPGANEQKHLAKVKNVLFLLIDAGRPDRLGILGNRRPITPNLDQLGKESLVFTNAKCEAAYTVASTATLLTGLPAEFHGVTYSFNRSLGNNFMTLAEMFKAKGFFTAAATANANFSTAFRFERGFDRFDEVFARIDDCSAPNSIVPFDNFLTEALEQKKPFFIYVHLIEPHLGKRLTPLPYFGKFQDVTRKNDKDLQNRLWDTYHNKNLNPAEILYFANYYDGSFSYIDSFIKRFIDKLKSAGKYNETLLVVLSDHGDGLGEHGIMAHGVIPYEEVIKIVQIVHIPGLAPRLENKPMLTSDLPVTLSETFALANPFLKYSSGENLLALASERRRLTRLLQTEQGYPGFAIEQFPFKLTLYFPYDDSRIQLFNLAQDPGEQRNLYRTDSLTAQALLQYLRSHLARATTVPRHIATPNLREQHQKNLKALGYLNE